VNEHRSLQSHQPLFIGTLAAPAESGGRGLASRSRQEPQVTTLVTTAASGVSMLDRARDALLGHDIHSAMDGLRASLRATRAALDAGEWSAFCRQARRHPVHRLLLESPFSRRAYDKPRGYAGDAVLMDLIYGSRPAARDLTPLGGVLYGYEFDSAAFQSVRIRRAILAREIDEVAAERPRPRILAVACGHLREADWSRSVRDRRVAFRAFDQDRDSLQVVEHEYGGYGVTAIAGTVGELLRRPARRSEFDLVYSAGLYDYLESDFAAVLTASLFRRLSPGGRLLVANFTPDTADAAFMESIMDWRLIYRDEGDMLALARSVPEGDVHRLDQFRDANRHVTYLRLVRR
jgi:SAM-dependent methyltransferase